MSIRYEHYDSEDSREVGSGQDREISLGTATVLGIFLALALVCALFFGFGYSMGRRSVPSALANVNTGISEPLPESRPTPGTVTSPHAAYAPPGESSAGGSPAVAEPTISKTLAGQKAKPAAAAGVTASHDAIATPLAAQQQQIARSVQSSAELRPIPGRAVPTTLSNPSSSAAGASFVQVAAISSAHREDAEMLKGSLQRRGYAVAIHQGTQDQLLHVQIGPLASKKDAEAMKARLLSDGYNAIVK